MIATVLIATIPILRNAGERAAVDEAVDREIVNTTAIATMVSIGVRKSVIVAIGW